MSTLTDEQIKELFVQMHAAGDSWPQFARAVIAAHEATKPGWMPIETAPQGMASRLYRVDGFCVQGFIDATGVLCAQNDRMPWRKMHGKPTHWMPLPSAPDQP